VDTSNEYIKMCTHPLLWELWEPKAGDFVHVKEKDEVITLGHDWVGVKKIRVSRGPVVEIAYLDTPVEICKAPDAAPVITEGISEGRNRYYFRRFTAPIWLPRQDQIQEMLRKETAPPTAFLVFQDFSSWLFKFQDWLRNHCDVAFTTLEKLWLMFFMYSVDELLWNKYKKVWERISPPIFRL